MLRSWTTSRREGEFVLWGHLLFFMQSDLLPRGCSFSLIYFSLSPFEMEKPMFWRPESRPDWRGLCDAVKHVLDGKSCHFFLAEMQALPLSLEGSDLHAPFLVFLHMAEPARPRLLFSDTVRLLLPHHCCIRASKRKNEKKCSLLNLCISL